MAFTCIIIDDEPLVCEQLTEYISEISLLTLIKSYTNSTIALREIMLLNEPVDIVFTDIEMPDLSGLDLVSKIRNKMKHLILISGHLHYALEGYKLKAHDFLPKPVGFQKFRSVVMSIINQAKAENPFIFVKTKEDKELVKVLLEEIIFIEAKGNYIQVNMKNKAITVILNLSHMEARLKNHPNFVRIHKSFIASTMHIEKFKNDFIYLSNGNTLSVSLTYRSKLAAYIDSI